MAINMVLNEKIGANMRTIRKAKGISQDELAAIVGLTRTSIVNIEKGRQTISVDILWSICEEFKISPADLFPKTEGCINIFTASIIHQLETEVSNWKGQYTELRTLLQKLKEHI